MRHRLAIAAALLLALAGCSDDSPGPKASASTTPATASPSPTGPVAPVLPEAAKANTSVGAKAFVRYWFESVTYGMKTGDTKPIDAVAHRECKTCDGLSAQIRKIDAKGAHLVGGGWRVDQISHDPRIDPPYYRFGVRVIQPAQRLIDRNGKVEEQLPRQVFVFWVAAHWDGGFQLYGVERIDD